MIQCAAHFPTTVFSSSVEDFPTNFYLSWHCVWSLTRPRNSIDRNIRNYLDRVRKSIYCMKNKNSKIWWNLICELLRCLARDRKCFHRSWFGSENIVVLDLFWRREVKIRFLRNDAFHYVFSRLHGNFFSNLKTPNLSHKLSKQTTSQPSTSFVNEDHRQIIVVTNHSESMLIGSEA